MNEKARVLLDYIEREFARGRVATLMQDDDLLTTGIIDSLGILQLVTFVEDRFHIRVPDEDVVFENFHSVEALVEYIEGP